MFGSDCAPLTRFLCLVCWCHVYSFALEGTIIELIGSTLAFGWGLQKCWNAANSLRPILFTVTNNSLHDIVQNRAIFTSHSPRRSGSTRLPIPNGQLAMTPPCSFPIRSLNCIQPKDVNYLVLRGLLPIEQPRQIKVEGYRHMKQNLAIAPGYSTKLPCGFWDRQPWCSSVQHWDYQSVGVVCHKRGEKRSPQRGICVRSRLERR